MPLVSAKSAASCRVMTGAAAAVGQLASEGVQLVLGIPGAHNLHLCDAVLDEPRLRFVTGRHEQSIAFMANGYARASGRIAAVFVISGAGVTNSMTALADAYADSVPMVLLAAAPARDNIGKGAFHEMKDQSATLASVTKWSGRIERVAEIPQAVHTAVAKAYEGRPGPTAVEIPADLQATTGAATAVPATEIERPSADAASVLRAAELIAAARAPVVVVGGGAARSDCGNELLELIERFEMACLPTASGRGLIPDKHPLCLKLQLTASSKGRKLLETADVALVVGAKLDEATTGGWSLPLPSCLIQIDTSAEMIGRAYCATVSLQGDGKAVLNQLLGALTTGGGQRAPSPAPQIAAIKAAALAAARRSATWPYIEVLRRLIRPMTIVANDASLANFWTLTHLDRSQPRTLNITRTMAALGYAWPAAIGAKLAYPDRPAVAVGGDGGFLFTCDALATAVQYELGVVSLVFNDNCYQTVKRLQSEAFGRHIGVDLVNPDLVALAHAYGAAAARAHTPGELDEVLRDALSRQGPTVIDIPLAVEHVPSVTAQSRHVRRAAPCP